MLGRIKENLSKREGNEAFEESSAAEIQEQNTSVDHQESTPSREEPDSRQPQDRGLYLMSSSGTSLDGRSFLVPMDREFDDVSSINTAQYGYGHEMRIIGSTEDEEKGDYGSPFEEIPLGEGQRKQQPSFEYHSAYPKRDEKSMGTSGSYDVGCLPLWITDAPRWLKVVIVLSTAILVGAIVLIGVGAALAVQKNKAETLQVSPPIPASPTQPVTNPPATAPTIDVGNAPFSPAPSKGNDDEQGTSTAPSAAAPSRPTTIPEGNMSSQAPAKSSVSFLVTGGRFTGDALAALPQQLKSLPQSDGNTVMFHLGDWNSPFATSCVEQSYQENVNLYSNSAVPVYFVPGDNEYNDCPNPEQAFAYWKEYLLDYETQFWPATDAWNSTRQQPDYAENFAYVYNGVLFVGINLVGGVVHNTREWQNRHQANLQWIDEQYYLNEGDFDVLVVLAHADPDIQANSNFFETFYERVQFNYKVQVLFVHRNLGVETWALEPQFNGVDNLMVVVVEGSIWPPMMIQLDTKAGTVDVDQGQWYEEYLALNA